MTRRIHPDVLALKRCVLALEQSSARMVKPTLEFLWDRYVVHPVAEHTARLEAERAQKANAA